MESNVKYVTSRDGKKFKTTLAKNGSVAVRMHDPRLKKDRDVIVDGHSVEACEGMDWTFLDPYTETKPKEK